MKLSDPAEYINKLKAVLEVTKAYRSIIHLDVLLSTIVETAAETVGAEAGSILLYDDEGKLRFHTASGRAAGAVKPMGGRAWTGHRGVDRRRRRARDRQRRRVRLSIRK